MTNPKLADELTALAEKAGMFGGPFDREARDEILRLVPALIAALTARSDGWRDIESAPRDGTRIIAGKWAWIHKEISTVFDEEAPKIWHLCFATTAFFLADKGYWTDGLERLVNPSHWLPLPTPPETTP